MLRKSIIIRSALFLFSLLYGAGTALRNWLFDKGLIKQKEYSIPLICVGNITAGGTGKTPHVEFLIHSLQSEYRLAVISRGYGRKTKGFHIASSEDTAETIGDEPMQIKNKFPNVLFILDAKRRRALDYIQSLDESVRPQLVLMDDGFQHRYVKPSFSILLVDVARPLSEDHLLPLGYLRESEAGVERAKLIIGTKVPSSFSSEEENAFCQSLKLRSDQQVLFSSLRYFAPRFLRDLSCSSREAKAIELRDLKVFAISGIANPKTFIAYLEEKACLVGTKIFKDHHHFTSSDLAFLNAKYSELKELHSEDIYFICTEKDAVRLEILKEELDCEVFKHFLYLPIAVDFRNGADQTLKNLLVDHVREAQLY